MSADFELNAIEETAAAWLVERDRGFLPERERKFNRWLEADARHARVFNALAETWSLINESGPVANVSARPVALNRSQRTWIPATMAAAAVITLACLGGWQWVSAIREDAAVPFALASATEVGALRTVPLPDGSVLQLNTDSAVEVDYSPAERRVRLTRGEVHFTVAKNRERPFIVSVAGVDVRVVGTIFNVRLRSAAVDVLVTEGKVRVDSTSVASAPRVASGRPLSTVADRHSDLAAGEKLSIGLSSPATPVAARVELSPIEIKQALAWQARRLDFDSTPLVEIVAEINRYNQHKLVIADSRLNDQKFGGSFPAGDYETFVRMLESNFGVVAEHLDDETRLRLKRP